MATNNCLNTRLSPTSGQILEPGQSGFVALKTTDSANVTGDGTVYTIICNSSLADKNSNYNTGTGVFTAPVTGFYLLTARATWYSNGPAVSVLYITASGKDYWLLNLPMRAQYTGFYGANVWLTAGGSILVYMSASDTAVLNIQGSGGTKIEGVYGNISPWYQVIFSGCLLG